MRALAARLDACQATLSTISKVPPDQRLGAAVDGCGGFFRRPGCRDTLQILADLPADKRELAAITGCATAYCDLLEGRQALAACGEGVSKLEGDALNAAGRALFSAIAAHDYPKLPNASDLGGVVWDLLGFKVVRVDAKVEPPAMRPAAPGDTRAPLNLTLLLTDRGVEVKSAAEADEIWSGVIPKVAPVEGAKALDPKPRADTLLVVKMTHERIVVEAGPLAAAHAWSGLELELVDGKIPPAALEEEPGFLVVPLFEALDKFVKDSAKDKGARVELVSDRKVSFNVAASVIHTLGMAGLFAIESVTPHTPQGLDVVGLYRKLLVIKGKRPHERILNVGAAPDTPWAEVALAMEVARYRLPGAVPSTWEELVERRKTLGEDAEPLFDKVVFVVPE